MSTGVYIVTLCKKRSSQAHYITRSSHWGAENFFTQRKNNWVINLMLYVSTKKKSWLKYTSSSSLAFMYTFFIHSFLTPFVLMNFKGKSFLLFIRWTKKRSQKKVLEIRVLMPRAMFFFLIQLYVKGNSLANTHDGSTFFRQTTKFSACCSDLRGRMWASK